MRMCRSNADGIPLGVLCCRGDRRSLAQVRSGRPASIFVPSAHTVSVTMDDIDVKRAIGVTFPFCVLVVSGLVFSRTRLANRKITRTAKATGTSSQPGIEPSAPTPSLN
jgi:hypothetical protein